jgi:NADPH:quinone reductase
MKAIVITTSGGPEVLQIAEKPVPEIKPDEVLIKVAAAGVNRPDIIQRQGRYPAPPGVPADIPGLEVAGVVEQVGAEERRWRPGDHVCALLAGGGYAEYVSVSGVQCLPVPAGLSLEEAASLPETFFTVWTNVFDRGRFESGESFLVHGGTSGIGVAAIQMVKALGGRVYATAGNDEKCAYAEKLGAVKCVNYKKEDFAEVLKVLEPKGLDIILDMIGGDYTPKNIALLATEGRLVIINAMAGATSPVDMMRVMVKRLTITGSTLRVRESSFKGAIADRLEKHVWPLVESKAIKPIVCQTFSLEKASEAHRLVESSEHIGKVVLKVQ